MFFVMRFARGGELFRQLRKVKRFPEEHARFYVAQLALAIGHLHSKKILYRDLKTENVLMDEDGYLCLTDFGLAKLLESCGTASDFCGTAEYMAPEVLSRDPQYSFPVDWWTLGILAYELHTSITPFVTGSRD